MTRVYYFMNKNELISFHWNANNELFFLLKLDNRKMMLDSASTNIFFMPNIKILRSAGNAVNSYETLGIIHLLFCWIEFLCVSPWWLFDSLQYLWWFVKIWRFLKKHKKYVNYVVLETSAVRSWIVFSLEKRLPSRFANSLAQRSRVKKLVSKLSRSSLEVGK